MHNVLIVDDEKNIVQLMKRFLEAAGGFNVTVACNGKAGLKAARHRVPDLILLDVRMPGLDGLSVLRQLGDDDRTKYVPVIMMTGDESEKTKQEAMYNYADEYLVKPIIRDVLLETVRRILDIADPE